MTTVLELLGSVYHTGFILRDYLPSNSKYDVILDHAHILFLSKEKNCCWKDCKTQSSSRKCWGLYSQEQQQ